MNKHKNEVFTPQWMVKKMISNIETTLLRNKLKHTNTAPKLFVNSTILEPTCGDGAFLIGILKDKLHVILNFRHQHWYHFAYLSLISLYGVELQSNLVKKAQKRLFTLVKQEYQEQINHKRIVRNPYFLHNCKQILKNHIIQGDILLGKNKHGKQLRFYHLNIEHHLIKTRHYLIIKPFYIPIHNSYTKLVKYVNQPLSRNIFSPDIIVGNPPYMIDNHAKNNASYSEIFQYFVEQAIALHPTIISMIIPNRWFSGGKNLKYFRQLMLNSNHLQSLNIWKRSLDVFKYVGISGGVNFFIWNKYYNNLVHNLVVNSYQNQRRITQYHRPLKCGNANIFVQDSIGAKIIQKLRPYLNKDTLANHTSSSNPFDLRTYFPKRSSKWHLKKRKTDLTCFANHKQIGYINKQFVINRMAIKRNKRKYLPYISRYKLLTPIANSLGLSAKSHTFKLILAKPNSICTESYAMLGMNLNKLELQHLAQYLHTPTIEYLIGLHKSSQHAVRKVYNFVPMLDFSNRSKLNWNKNIDKQLIQLFKLTPTERRHIQQNY